MNWRAVWEKKYRERARAGMRTEPGPGYWDKVAEDYSQWNKSNDYEYGRKAIEAIREIITPDSEALDIGAGPGTLALPFAKVVRKMTAIEPSPVIVKYLRKGAEEQRVDNIEVINRSWQEINDADITKRFDIVACSHLLWQFEDLDKQLKRMEGASRGYCCVVHPAGGADPTVKALWPEVTGKKYAGEVDPDLDDLVFVMLREREILVDVRVIDYTLRLSTEQEVRLVTRLLGKHAEITPTLTEVIRKAVLGNSGGVPREIKSNAIVMWWQAPQ